MRSSIYILVLALTSLFACQQPADYSQSIRLADSLARRTDSICVYQANAGAHALRTRKDSILRHLGIIQSNYRGIMPTATALFLSEYRTLANDIDRICILADTLNQEGLAIKQQLANLSDALKNKATHDALDNEIDTAYVRIALQKEISRQKNFEEKSQSIQVISDSIRDKFDGYYPLIRQLTDSLLALKK